MLFRKIDIIRNKIKKWRTHVNINAHFWIESMNCIPNFIAITMPEETRIHSWRKETYKQLKCKAFQGNIGVKNAKFLELHPVPFGGANSASPLTPDPPAAFFPCLATLGRLIGQVPPPKFNSCISPWHHSW